MDKKARSDASAEIRRIFAVYRKAQSSDAMVLKALTDGKLYELFVLSHVIEDLKNRGFTIAFKGAQQAAGVGARSSTLKFKASPGKISNADSHFEISCPQSSTVDFRIFVDIEFETLGHQQNGATDNSQRHELDIVVTTAANGYPKFYEIALAVECKAVANFQKRILREALGVRRELSFLRDLRPSTLSRSICASSVYVQAYPASEFLLIFIDPKGISYSQSPAAFGIELRHLPP
ncbi:MAG: hypothetical protein ING96_18250 [Roseomonas sp.]|nr:hypothetical protein [Roseomonas sp.]